MRFILVILLLLTCLPARANMAAPWRPGDAVGEPSAGLQAIAVDSEKLVLDLRPLATRGPAVVEATYQINVKVKSKPLSLVFVAPGQEGRSEVWLDEKPLEVSLSEQARDVPREWNSPAKTPRPGGGQELVFMGHEPKRVFQFTVDPKLGAHTLRVRYQLQATAICSDSSVVYWQLAYVLAPARQWASFGTLEAQVLVPRGWSTATSLPMSPSEEGLQATWKGIPADNLGVSVQAPVPPVEQFLPAVALASLGLCALAGWAAGVFVSRRGRRLLWVLPWSLFVGVAGSAAFLAVTLSIPEWLIPAGQVSWNWSYGQAMGALVLSVPMALGGLLAAQLAAWIAHSRRSRVFQSHG